MNRQIKVTLVCFFGIIVTSGLINMLILYHFSNTVVIYIPNPVIRLLETRQMKDEELFHPDHDNVDRSTVNNKHLVNISGLNNTRKTTVSLLTEISETKLLMDQNICKGDKILLTILIFSTPGNIDRRRVIRETWLSNVNALVVRYVFVLAKSSVYHEHKQLQEESEEHKDIIQFDFVDSYKNLTYKTVSSFKWAIKSCPHASYVLKIDDDVWLNIKSLLGALSHGALEGAIGGSCSRREKPIRDPSNKYYISEAMYPSSEYPPFCSGTAYVADIKVIRGIIRVSKVVPFFPLEDIYVAFCIKKLKARVVNLYGFYSVHVRANPCWIKSDWLITTHEFQPFEMSRIWRTRCNGLQPIQTLRPALKPNILGPLTFKKQEIRRRNRIKMFQRNALKTYNKNRVLVFNK